ncbi:MAG TPA: hypothetical protein VMR95_01700 [Candidatus Binatia bacterium]|nr:hypothetical protein [Candidatus Binatia bacterium]
MVREYEEVPDLCRTRKVELAAYAGIFALDLNGALRHSHNPGYMLGTLATIALVEAFDFVDRRVHGHDTLV